MSQTIVAVTDLVKTYGKRNVVDGISFSVKAGEIFGILGPNGAGKTTTLEMLETMRPIDGGSAVIDGIDVAKSPQKIKSLIGVQPQTPSFEEKTKLVELIEFFAVMHSMRRHYMLQYLRQPILILPFLILRHCGKQ